ncbi:MAG: hypothetical protein K2M86_04195, partial [Odoribacter sp.]|nr:hypothetical protein [Odoribacter sp.]
LFAVPENATDATSLLRKAFFEATRVHVLFNDTLRHERQGVNSDGSPRYYTETIDLNWNMTTNVSTRYSWEYLNESDYQEAADFCKDYLLPHLGGLLRPYSVFLVNNLYEEYRNNWRSINYINNYRCLAVNAGAVCGGASDAEKETVYQDICKAILKNKLTNDVLEEFGASGEPYYYYDFGDFEEDFTAFRSSYRNARYDWWDAEDAYDEAVDAYENGEISEEEWQEAQEAYEEAEAIWKEIEAGYLQRCREIANEYGFISFYTSYGSFPYGVKEDMEAFINLIFEKTEKEVEEIYADYPKVIEKYRILKQVISEFGFIS